MSESVTHVLLAGDLRLVSENSHKRIRIPDVIASTGNVLNSAGLHGAVEGQLVLALSTITGTL